jgi:hypothetical protein
MDAEAVRRFSEGLPAGGRILDLSANPSPERGMLQRLGFEIQSAGQRDPRLLSLAPSSWDGAWCNRGLEPLQPTEIQRVLGALFQGLRPGGHLFLALAHPTLTQDPLAALLRQSGFRLLLAGHPVSEPGVTAFLAARI